MWMGLLKYQNMQTNNSEMNLTKAAIDVLCHKITDLVNQHQNNNYYCKGLHIFPTTIHLCANFYKFNTWLTAYFSSC